MKAFIATKESYDLPENIEVLDNFGLKEFFVYFDDIYLEDLKKSPKVVKFLPFNKKQNKKCKY